MKVLIVSAYPPDPAPEANHALHLGEHLADAGLAVHVLCKRGSIGATRPGIVVHPVMTDWSWSDVGRLEACLRDARPDVVLLLYIGWVFHHHPMITYLPTFCRRVLPGVACVTQFENVDKGAPSRRFIERVRRKTMALRAGRGAHGLFGTLLRDSARVIALSTPHRAQLARACPDVEDKTEILPPPPLIRFCTDPVAARARARADMGVERDAFVWTYWGYIYPGKGVETLLQAFRLAARRRADLHLVLVGGSLEFPTGPISCAEYYRRVRALPETLGIADRVHWTGPFTWDSDLGSRFLYGGDACVLPFDYGVTLNNSSLAAAATHALPVLGTELPAGRDEMLEHGRNVYLCAPRDPEMLAEALELIGNSAELRARLREGARDLARDWHDWTATTRRLIATLESAAGASATSSPVLPASSAAPPPSEPGVGATAPSVSVIVAAHNVEKYLSLCLDALVHQTLPGVEIIVVDDASTDGSGRLIEAYRARHPQVRVIRCERNVGLATVRNLGLRSARGQYVAFADGDDWVDVRMCEVLYRKARAEDADVVIADAHVYYEDACAFAPLFDRHVRRNLDERLRVLPFDLASEPRALLLEPVAWTKLYRRSFLQAHGLRFEDGMNSYEDVCFHFSVLLKARRIVLVDEAVAFYRQNRPGQISGRTNRKVFEVFDVFRKIHDNLAAWKVSDDVWAMFVRVQLRQFDWLIKDRVRPAHKREFLALVARQLAAVPQSGLRAFAREATRDELARLLCLRRQWLPVYERLLRQRMRWFPLLHAAVRDPRPGRLRRGTRRGWAVVRRRAVASYRALVSKSLDLPTRWETVEDRLDQLSRRLAHRSDEPQFEAHRIGGQAMWFCCPPYRSGLRDAVWRVESDYYLSRMAVFREGDTVVDIGAHVGAFALVLAKRFPFVRVIAVEPDPLNYACLERNIAMNGARNVVPVRKAVADAARQRTLYVDADDSAWATLDPVAAASRRALRTATVETLTLDQLFQEHAIHHCRVLKINAPGAVGAILGRFARTASVDLLCGEASYDDCSRVKLEAASWRVARQHFWRTIGRRRGMAVYGWLHRLPVGIETPAVVMPDVAIAPTPVLSADPALVVNLRLADRLSGAAPPGDAAKGLE